MRMTALLPAAAIALAMSIGSASAADRFTTLEGVTATAMSQGDMDAVIGRFIRMRLSFMVHPRGTRGPMIKSASHYALQGLLKASSRSGVIRLSNGNTCDL